MYAHGEDDLRQPVYDNLTLLAPGTAVQHGNAGAGAEIEKAAFGNKQTNGLDPELNGNVLFVVRYAWIIKFAIPRGRCSCRVLYCLCYGDIIVIFLFDRLSVWLSRWALSCTCVPGIRHSATVPALESWRPPPPGLGLGPLPRKFLNFLHKNGVFWYILEHVF